MSGRWFPLEPPRESGRPLPSSAPKRPLTVTISLWLYVAASALSLVGMVIGVIEFPAAREAAEREAADQGKQLPEGYLDVFNTSAVMGVLAALIFAGVFVVFAVVMWRGGGWARGVLVTFATLGAAGVFGGLLAIVPFLLVAVATVLSFLPASNEFFRVGRAWKTKRPR